MSCTFLWLCIQDAPASLVRPEIKLRQLTANSAENHVVSGVISLDGRYLAYSDARGLHVKLVDTGEIRDIPTPDSLEMREVEWECVAWFPDNTQLLVNAYPAGTGPDYFSRGSSVWIFSLSGAPPRMLREQSAAYAISEDRSLISFGTNKGKSGEREIWLMSSSGDRARKVYKVDENHAIGGNGWSPNGERILFPLINGTGLSLISCDLNGGSILTAFSAQQVAGLNSFFWLPNGRFVYSLPEPAAITSTYNFWLTRLDKMGKPIEPRHRLTNLTGFGMVPTSATKDSKRLAFLQWAFHTTVYVADLEGQGSHVGSARHFTLTESQDIAADWTADSKALILLSNRSGHNAIYKQSLEMDAPEILVGQVPPIANPRVSADGKWVLYLSEGKAMAPTLMRAPITGGASEPVFRARPRSVPLCARAFANGCAIAEPQENGELAISAFDAMRGRGGELLHFKVENPDLPVIDLSPDWTQFAVIRTSNGPIELYSFLGRPTGSIRPIGLSTLQFVRWAANGHGLYVATGEEGGRVLWHTDLHGKTHRLWKNRGGNWALGVPSPDGKYLAIESSDQSGNLWIMENF